MCPVGDGSRLYVTAHMLAHDGGRSFFVEFKDGQVRATAEGVHPAWATRW